MFELVFQDKVALPTGMEKLGQGGPAEGTAWAKTWRLWEMCMVHPEHMPAGFLSFVYRMSVGGSGQETG